MIHFENVTKKYSANTGIDNVSLDIDRGEFVFSRTERSRKIHVYKIGDEGN